MPSLVEKNFLKSHTRPLRLKRKKPKKKSTNMKRKKSKKKRRKRRKKLIFLETSLLKKRLNLSQRNRLRRPKNQKLLPNLSLSLTLRYTKRALTLMVFGRKSKLKLNLTVLFGTENPKRLLSLETSTNYKLDVLLKMTKSTLMTFLTRFLLGKMMSNLSTSSASKKYDLII